MKPSDAHLPPVNATNIRDQIEANRIVAEKLRWEVRATRELLAAGKIPEAHRCLFTCEADTLEDAAKILDRRNALMERLVGRMPVQEAFATEAPACGCPSEP